MTIGQPHAQQRTLPRAERRERHAAPRAPLSPGPGGGSKASGRPHSPRAHSPRHDGGARATPPRRHFIRLFGRIQTKQCPRPRTDRQGASLVRPPPQTTGISELEGRRRLRTIVRRGVCDGTAASLFVKSRTQIPTTPRTARERPRTPTWSSRSRSRPTMRARPYPPHVIVSISGQFFTQLEDYHNHRRAM